MANARNWRLARFTTRQACCEFIRAAESLHLEGVELEPEIDPSRVRFSAPAAVEQGIASMVVAHGGCLIPYRP